MPALTQEKQLQRHTWLDALRGLALLNMIAYHASWDLVYLLGVDWPWFSGSGAHLWQQGICRTFILLSGFCWCLSRRWLRHGVKVFVSGLLVTAVTQVAMPDNVVWWGVLTFLGAADLLTGVLQPLLRRIPPWAGLFGAYVLFELTENVEWGTLAGRDLPLWLYSGGHLSAFLGFPPQGFFSTDYFPLLPWLFWFLMGYFLFFLWKPYGEHLSLGSRPVPVLGWLGRHSLLVYLVHQPALYALMLVYQLVT